MKRWCVCIGVICLVLTSSGIVVFEKVDYSQGAARRVGVIQLEGLKYSPSQDQYY